MSRGCDIGRGVGQAAGRGQRTGRAADSVVGDAAARVPVPRASAQNAGRRDVHQLVVGGAVGVCGHGGRRALAGNGRRRGELSRLSVGQGDTGGGGGERDRGHIRDLHPVTQAIAVVHARVAGAAGDRNPGRNGQAQQTNKRQKPPHETSPPRLVEPRNGLFRTHRRIWVIANFPSPPPIPATAQLSSRLTKRARETPMKSVSGQGGNRQEALPARPPPPL